MKSSIAAPSFRNSGFETTSIGCVLCAAQHRADTRSAVPTGTVLLIDHDLVAVQPPADRFRDRHHRRQVGGAVSGPSGVPTAMKQIRDRAHRRVEVGAGTAAASAARCAAPALRGRARRSATSPRCSAAILRASTSTQMTSLPLSAKHVPATRPTYPVPTTQMFMGDSPVSSGRAAAPSSLYAALPRLSTRSCGRSPGRTSRHRILRSRSRDQFSM